MWMFLSKFFIIIEDKDEKHDQIQQILIRNVKEIYLQFKNLINKLPATFYSSTIGGSPCKIPFTYSSVFSKVPFSV
jgi:hypothetical protein